MGRHSGAELALSTVLDQEAHATANIISSLVQAMRVAMSVSHSLPKFAMRLMSTQVVRSRKSSFAPKVGILTCLVVMLRFVQCHVLLEVRAFCVEPLIAHGAVSFTAVMTRNMLVPNLLVHE